MSIITSVSVNVKMHLCKHIKIQVISTQVIHMRMQFSTATAKFQTKKFEITLSSTKNVTPTS